MANHTYYQGMIANRTNRKLVIMAIVSVAIPLIYIVRGKVFSVKKFFVYIMPFALLFFTTAFVMIKDSIIGWSTWWIILMINTLLIYFLGMYAILGLTAFWTWISKKFIQFKEIRRQEMVINFWIGLGIFLLLIYVFAMANMLRGVLIWIMFFGLGFMIWRMKSDMAPYKLILSDIAGEFKKDKLKENRWKRLGVILLAISLLYYMYGFQLSVIPYSTAWDANHAYMYVPKILAENNWVMRWARGAASMIPGFWHMFITFWFALITPIKSRFWMAPDTIAVAMNFLSGILVLIFGTGLIKEVISYFTSKKEENEEEKNDVATTVWLYSGWMMLLFWLTSGMGAFLVFVDNKTDLGVMALTILAMLSGFIFLKYVLNNREHWLKIHRDSLKYIIISWVMFARALMAKQTAFIDIAMFGLLLIWLWINSLIAIGAGIMTIGMTWILQIANAPDMLNPVVGKYIVLIGLVVVILGVLQMFMKKQRTKDIKRLLKYIGIWALTIVAVVLAFKWPNVLISQISEGTFSPSNFIKSTLLVQQQDKILLATADAEEIFGQTAVDKEVLNATNLSLEQCTAIDFSEEDLQDGVREAVVTNEDVGRYVWYGWKDIRKGGGLNLGYGFLRMLTPKNDTCYGTNAAAKLLCNNAQAIESFNVPTLQSLLTQLKKDTEAYTLVAEALAAYEEKWTSAVINPTEYRDWILAIKKYYQNHAIFAQEGVVNIPYRYLIPFNITFNRSLQNLSSYYTDIGFVWLLVFGLLVIGLIYTLCNRKRFKQDTNIPLLIGVSLIGRAIRWVIGWGILWYGMGLIVWTVIAVALVLKDLFTHNKDEKDKTMFYIILFLFGIRALIQFTINFVRISSQWGWGPFLRYRMNNGKVWEITTNLQQKEVVKSAYGRTDVFNLQFPHYNKFIEYTKERSNDDGVLIAGTYIQYFLHNQHNLRLDGMLNWFREQISDGNMCKSYQRLKEANLKYIVIDPNIGTVVMGEGNESLFDRFFAKKDPVTGKIQEDGAISSLVKLRNAWYIQLFGTNNLGAKYAFILDDASLVNKFGPMTEDELVFLRSKLAIARFFSDSQELLNFIGEVFTQRVGDGQAISDIADVYGKTIDERKVLDAANIIVAKQQTSEEMQQVVEQLTQDERMILTQYLGLYNLLNANNPQYSEFLNSIISQSLGGGSQLIVFELN